MEPAARINPRIRDFGGLAGALLGAAIVRAKYSAINDYYKKRAEYLDQLAREKEEKQRKELISEPSYSTESIPPSLQCDETEPIYMNAEGVVARAFNFHRTTYTEQADGTIVKTIVRWDPQHTFTR